MKFSGRQWMAIGGVAVLMIAMGILVALAQQRRDIRDRIDPQVAANDGVLDCDPGPDPYNSNSITISNNSDEAVDNISFDVFRCPYVPGMVEQYRGSFKCEPTCSSNEPNCLEGVWDSEADQRNVVLAPGDTRTFTESANDCEIIQIDVRNDDENNGNLECHNVQSRNTVQPGEIWPGGISFGISQNADGYPECEQPTPTATPIVPTATPTSTPIPGVPTNTPAPAVCQSPYNCIRSTSCVGKGAQTTAGNCSAYGANYICCIPGSLVTPQPTRPVAGSAEITVISIIGGIGLLVLAAFVLK